jgi:hypothetical protein
MCILKVLVGCVLGVSFSRAIDIYGGESAKKKGYVGGYVRLPFLFVVIEIFCYSVIVICFVTLRCLGL